MRGEVPHGDPGVRFADGEVGDQVRVTTPERAKEIGSDYIVVGRPITQAKDPVAAYRRWRGGVCGVSMAFDTILFDLDGTLTDSGPGIMNGVEYAVREMGLAPHPKEFYRRFIGPPSSGPSGTTAAWTRPAPAGQ